VSRRTRLSPKSNIRFRQQPSRESHQVCWGLKETANWRRVPSKVGWLRCLTLGLSISPKGPTARAAIFYSTGGVATRDRGKWGPSGVANFKRRQSYSGAPASDEM
jgi:hypothetical protein